MKANELRIGNLFRHQIDGSLIIINAKDILNISNGMDAFITEPIQLTEEWHNKFGVTKNGFGYFEYVLNNKNNLKIFNYEKGTNYFNNSIYYFL